MFQSLFLWVTSEPAAMETWAIWSREINTAISEYIILPHMWSSLIISKLSSIYWMELASLFLVRINLFFPFPVQWMLIYYTLQRLGQMTLAKGFDDQFWYKSDTKKQERVCIRWSVGEINSHLMLLNVCARCIHLKHSIQKQAQCTRRMLGQRHGQSTG